jgi:phosphoenolpyruvate carboxylase
MSHVSSYQLQQFNNYVGLKFQLYNSLFTALPFHRIEKTGILLSLLLNNCEEGYKQAHSPVEIIEDFFQKHTSYTQEEDRLNLLFRFIQYVERQVVLFDALEDAAFTEVNDMQGKGTLKHLAAEMMPLEKQEALNQQLQNFSIRLVLTAHPTQFYPGSVLGIINDLSRALADNNAGQINIYLQQLGKTAFLNKQKPTPFDEATSLIWYLENVFYNAVGKILSFLKTQLSVTTDPLHPIISMGFWPGGDRDGNPNVTAATTLQVADALRSSIIKCYYVEVRRLKRRLTFKGVDVLLTTLEKELYNNVFIPDQKTALTQASILATLHAIKEIIIYQHNSLFLHLVENLINKVEVFGLHFASLDIRQDSAVHDQVLAAIATEKIGLPEQYATLTEAEKMKALTSLNTNRVVQPKNFDNPLVQDTLQSIAAIQTIHQFNGAAGCHRYIISQCSSAVQVVEVMALFQFCGFDKAYLPIDIVPLFETINDLQQAAAVMKVLYENATYAQHLLQRKKMQTIMVGFSDGTKDGGYLMANWSIYKAKEQLTQLSKQYGIDVLFFDGRGGPPARGGGKTHKFYASMGNNIANKEIQLTVQGQTVSSNFGTVDAARYNIEQLLNAGISNNLFSTRSTTLEATEEVLLSTLAQESYDSYCALKSDPYFLDYLLQVSPLRFYAETNIGSRPAKRSASAKLSLKDLRAIPFVGAWSQLKQNVTGYYGVGTALEALAKRGQLPALKALYQNSLFFKTLLDNCEMAMRKCFFPLTAHLAKHPVYGTLWDTIHAEYERTKRYIFIISGNTELMHDYPVEQLSVQMREKIVLPLLTIQQYAIACIRQMEQQLINHPLKASYEKLVIRCSFGIINAGRNSA